MNNREIRIPFIDLAPGDHDTNKQHQVCIVCAYNLQSERERECIQSQLTEEFGTEIFFRPLSQEGIMMISYRYYSHFIINFCHAETNNGEISVGPEVPVVNPQQVNGQDEPIGNA